MWINFIWIIVHPLHHICSKTCILILCSRFSTWQLAAGINFMYSKLLDLNLFPNQIKQQNMSATKFPSCLEFYLMVHRPSIPFTYKWTHSLNLEFSCTLDLIGCVGCQLWSHSQSSGPKVKENSRFQHLAPRSCTFPITPMLRCPVAQVILHSPSTKLSWDKINPILTA